MDETIKLTHQALLARLAPNSVYFSNIIESYPIFAEESAMHNEVALESIR
jgi:hypothetical protein